MAKVIIEIEDMPNGSIQIRPSGDTYSNPMTDAQMMFILFQKIAETVEFIQMKQEERRKKKEERLENNF